MATTLPEGTKKVYPQGQNPGLRYVEPYYHPYRTFAKQRWIGRELLEVVSTEFRDRSVEYYRHALEAGVTTLNGKVAGPETIINNGDALQNIVHRHEPPVSAHPIQVIFEDPGKQFIVIDKPGSVPVHPTGRYTKNTCTEMLASADFPYGKVWTVNRLDRLTSGLMFFALNAKAANSIISDFIEGRVRKEYLARVRGKFPEGETIVDQPLLTVDRQSGLVIVTPEGKEAKTRFERVFYDAARDESVVSCFPQTGRTHQIRVHLQYLGHPICNDPIYSLESVWGPTGGQGGLDLTPAMTPNLKKDYAPPLEALEVSGVEEAKRRVADRMQKLEGAGAGAEVGSAEKADRKLMPRETGEDVGSSSPILLSEQARDVIRGLRRMKDAAEDWARWKDVVLYTSEAMRSPAMVQSLSAALPKGDYTPQNRFSNDTRFDRDPSAPTSPPSSPQAASSSLPTMTPAAPAPFTPPEGFCPTCYIPLAPDPDPDQLFIYLHARRYRTSFGEFETGLPIWAREDWAGNDDWEGRAKGQGAGGRVKRTEEERKLEEELAERVRVGVSLNDA